MANRSWNILVLQYRIKRETSYVRNKLSIITSCITYLTQTTQQYGPYRRFNFLYLKRKTWYNCAAIFLHNKYISSLYENLHSNWVQGDIDKFRHIGNLLFKLISLVYLQDLPVRGFGHHQKEPRAWRLVIHRVSGLGLNIVGLHPLWYPRMGISSSALLWLS